MKLRNRALYTGKQLLDKVRGRGQNTPRLRTTMAARCKRHMHVSKNRLRNKNAKMISDDGVSGLCAVLKKDFLHELLLSLGAREEVRASTRWRQE